MLKEATPTAFIATTDPAGARSFYEGALGLDLVEQTPFALVFDCGGHVLRVTTVRRVEPAPYTVFGWQVPSILDTIDELSRLGVETVRFDDVQQDEHGVWTSPGRARVAWFRDRDGNVLSLTEVMSPPPASSAASL